MSLNKSIVESAALGWFLLRQRYGREVGEQRYAVGHRQQFAPGIPAVERESFSEVMLVGRLREAIRRLNPAISQEARAIHKESLFVQIERRQNP